MEYHSEKRVEYTVERGVEYHRKRGRSTEEEVIIPSESVMR